MLLDRLFQLRAGQRHHDQVIAERHHREGVLVPDFATGQIDPHARRIDQSQLRPALGTGAGRGKHRIGDQIGGRAFPVEFASPGNRGQSADHAIGERRGGRDIGADIGLDCRVLGRARAGVDDIVDRALAGQAPRLRIEGQPDVGHQIAILACTGQQSSRTDPARATAILIARATVADIGPMSMARYDRGNRRVQPGNDRLDLAEQTLATIATIERRQLAPLVDQQHDRVRSIRLERRHQGIGGRGFVGEDQSPDCRWRHQIAGRLERHADEADPDRPRGRGEAFDPARREHGRPVGLDDIGGEIAEAAARKRLDRARHPPRMLGAAAVLHPFQLKHAFVEFMIADRVKLEPDPAHRLDCRLVEKQRRGQRGRADRVAGRNRHRPGRCLPQSLQVGRQLRRAARRQLDLGPVGFDHFDRRRGFEIAVEIVERENLDLDRLRGNGWRRDARRRGRDPGAGRKECQRDDRQPATHGELRQSDCAAP